MIFAVLVRSLTDSGDITSAMVALAISPVCLNSDLTLTVKFSDAHVCPQIILPYGVIGKMIGAIAQGMSSATVDEMFAKPKVLYKA